jgi:ribonucleoside-diphosphate reductase subunit M1
MNIPNKMSDQNSSYYVVKRDGSQEPIYFDKITTRIEKLLDGNMKNNVNIIDIVKKTIESIVPGITTQELDNHSAYHCASMATTHYDYMLLAGRILISSLHKETMGTFVEKMEYIQRNLGLFDDKWLSFICDNRDTLNASIDYENDYLFDFFGFKTMERTYIIKHNGKIIERPQDVFMRVASLVHCGNVDKTIESYKLMAKNCFTHASPTLFNAGNKTGNLVSCFLLGTEDSIEGITKTWSDVSSISKWGGGIGIHVSNIRAKGSKIRSTNGQSDGIIPMLQVYNSIARYVNQSGKRRGSFAIYLEPHHADVLDFLELRKNTGAESERARDLFLALWVSDLFMRQVQADSEWYLMCPDECPGLNDVYGEEYEKLYQRYVSEGKYRHKLKARKLWDAIMTSQFETGSPYILYKDNINNCSNQKNIGIIRSSNLCAEIVEYSDANETAACNLASISLSTFVKEKEITKDDWVIYTLSDCTYCKWAKNILKYKQIPYEEIVVNRDDESYKMLKSRFTESDRLTFPIVYQKDNLIGGMEDLYSFLAKDFDYEKLWQVAYHVTENLNQVIDHNIYPTVESRRSNVKHRPIGLGVQGLADVFAMMRVPYGSEKALDINKKIFAVLYHASLSASCDITVSREERMKKIVTYFRKNPEYRPLSDFYEPGFTCPSVSVNRDYHALRPCQRELKMASHFGAYSSFKGSPFSQGKLQYHLWNVEPVDIASIIENKDWSSLIEKIKMHGVRNSLLTALMPTASTSQLLGNYESFEPFTSNLYTRKTLAGEFIVVNKHLIQDLTEIGVWNSGMKNEMMRHGGSVQQLSIPKLIKEIYLTAYEMKQKWILDGCITRGPYIDQTQSMNLYFSSPDSQKLTSAQFYAWRNGLKTGLYYLRSKPAGTGAKIGIKQNQPKIVSKEEDNCLMCSA